MSWNIHSNLPLRAQREAQSFHDGVIRYLSEGKERIGAVGLFRHRSLVSLKLEDLNRLRTPHFKLYYGETYSEF